MYNVNNIEISPTSTKGVGFWPFLYIKYDEVSGEQITATDFFGRESQLSQRTLPRTTSSTLPSMWTMT